MLEDIPTANNISYLLSYSLVVIVMKKFGKKLLILASYLQIISISLFLIPSFFSGNIVLFKIFIWLSNIIEPYITPLLNMIIIFLIKQQNTKDD